MEKALGALRSSGWPAPEDPDASDDEELAGTALVADRLDDEVGWLRQCAEWLDHLEHKTFPPAANLRPEGDHPNRCHVVVNWPGLAPSCGASPSMWRRWPAPDASRT